MPGPRHFLRVLFAILLLGAVRAEALEVRQVLWGFDGRVVPGRFNPVSVLMANPGGAAYDGTMTLVPTLGYGGPRGAAYVQPVFLGPQSERWVQFEAFIAAGAEEFILVWGRGAKDREVFDRQLQTGPPACVWLMDANDALRQAGSVQGVSRTAFPDDRLRDGRARRGDPRPHAALGAGAARGLSRLGAARRHGRIWCMARVANCPLSPTRSRC